MKDFKQLLSTIEHVHQNLQATAASAVNRALTIRNWLIGFYIVEFEQKGKDRAKYGENLIENISKELNHIKGIDRRSLFRFREFYMSYPEIGDALHKDLNSGKVGTLSPQFLKSKIVGSLYPQ